MDENHGMVFEAAQPFYRKYQSKSAHHTNPQTDISPPFLPLSVFHFKTASRNISTIWLSNENITITIRNTKV